MRRRGLGLSLLRVRVKVGAGVRGRRKVHTKDTHAMKGMRHCRGTWLGLGLGLGLRLRLGLDPPLRGHLVRVRVRVK